MGGSPYIQGMEEQESGGWIVSVGRLFVVAVALIGVVGVYKLALWAGISYNLTFLGGIGFGLLTARVLYGYWP